MNRRVTILTAVLFAAGIVPTEAMAAKKEIKGYITEISPAEQVLSIARYTVAISPTIRYVVENNERLMNLTIDTLRLGDFIEVKGEIQGTQYNLLAEEIRIDAEQYEEKIKRSAYLHKPIEGLTQSGKTWSGMMIVDGQRVEVIPDTRLYLKLNTAEKEALKKQGKLPKSTLAEGPEKDLKLLAELTEVGPGDKVEYSGMRTKSGSVEATQLVFEHNILEKGEQRMFQQLEGQYKAPVSNLTNPKHGELKVQGSSYKLYYDLALQEYVNQLGMYLVPEYITKMPAGHPNKLDFHFFVVDGEPAPNAFAYPNGLVAVNTAMLLLLENEAQLAFVLGHEISHATNEHAYRQQMFHRKKRVALGIAALATGAMGYDIASSVLQVVQSAITSGYQRFLEDQSDRVGLMYAFERGYDPTQAVDAWRLMADAMGNSATNYFWSDHSSHLTRMSHLLVLIRNNFPEMSNDSFSKFSQGKERYLKVTQGLREDPKLAKLQKNILNKGRQEHVIWHDTSLMARPAQPQQ
jgi:hypothetical protein